MACTDGGYSERELREETNAQLRALKKRVTFLEASLCGALNAMELVIPNHLDSIDYIEAGITHKALSDWWANHKAEDALRKQCESQERAKQAAAKAKAALRAGALSKLTLSEREALGLTGIKED